MKIMERFLMQVCYLIFLLFLITKKLTRNLWKYIFINLLFYLNFFEICISFMSFELKDCESSVTGHLIVGKLDCRFLTCCCCDNFCCLWCSFCCHWRNVSSSQCNGVATIPNPNSIPPTIPIQLFITLLTHVSGMASVHHLIPMCQYIDTSVHTYTCTRTHLSNQFVCYMYLWVFLPPIYLPEAIKCAKLQRSLLIDCFVDCVYDTWAIIREAL